MHTFKISLNTIDKVKDFAKAARSMSFYIRVSSTNGNEMVDATSVLGLFSLPLTEDVTVTVPSVLEERRLRSALNIAG